MNGKKLRIVVKIGSGVLSHPAGGVDGGFLIDFVDSLSRLHMRGHDIAVVSSGAIRIGAPKLKIDKSGDAYIAKKQAAAAVGQGILIARYTELFAGHDIVAAQVLLTPDITNYRKKYLNARNTLRTLLDYRAVPIINENDTVSYDEIKFGDNDTLSAISAILVEADLLILLSDVKGLYTGDPRTGSDVQVLEEVMQITPEITAAAGGPAEGGGFGGMATKIAAAQAAMDSGIKMVIAHGREEKVVERIVAGEKIGTAFTPSETGLSARKKWIAFGCRPDARIVVNDGARQAIIGGGKSLLAIGITGTEKSFDHGECVEICGPDGECFARGLTNYSSLEIESIKGKPSGEIEKILSFKISDEVIHRDDMVIV